MGCIDIFKNFIFKWQGFNVRLNEKFSNTLKLLPALRVVFQIEVYEMRCIWMRSMTRTDVKYPPLLKTRIPPFSKFPDTVIKEYLNVPGSHVPALTVRC